MATIQAWRLFSSGDAFGNLYDLHCGLTINCLAGIWMHVNVIATRGAEACNEDIVCDSYSY